MKGFPKPYRRGDNIKQAKPFPLSFLLLFSRKLDYYLIGKFTGTGPNFYFILIQIRSKREEEEGPYCWFWSFAWEGLAFL